MFNGNNQHENIAFDSQYLTEPDLHTGDVNVNGRIYAQKRCRYRERYHSFRFSGLYAGPGVWRWRPTGVVLLRSDYDTGKKIFLERVVCDTCPYASLELNSEKVGAVWPNLQLDLKKAGAIGQELSWWQRISAEHYIKNRFSL